MCKQVFSFIIILAFTLKQRERITLSVFFPLRIERSKPLTEEVLPLLSISSQHIKMSSVQNSELPNQETVVNVNEFVSVENPDSRRSKFGSFFKNPYPPGFSRKLVAEVISTYLLVFVTCGAAALNANDQRRVSQLGASVAGGLIVTVMIYAVGHISGAHMNPAVTMAFAATRHFPWKQVPLYGAAQLSGATCAAFTLRLLLHPIKHLGTTTPSGSDFQALVMEIVVTFSMMFVTAAVATDTKAVGELAGMAVGSAVCITSILAGPVSGGSMNPVRTLGPALASDYYKGLWVYFVGPVVGTQLGAWSYKFIRASDKPVHLISPHSFSLKLRRMSRSDISEGER